MENSNLIRPTASSDEYHAKREIRQQRALVDILQLSFSTVGCSEVMDRVLKATLSASEGSYKGAIFLSQRETEALEFAADWALDEESQRLFSHPSFSSFLSDRAANLDGVAFISGEAVDPRAGVTSFAQRGHYLVPVRGTQGNVLAVMILFPDDGCQDQTIDKHFLDCVAGVLTSLIEQRRTHSAGEATRQELSYIKQALDEHSIVATTNVKGDITYVNDKFCAISGYNREELIGKNHNILNSHHHPKSFFVDMYRTIASGKSWQGEIRNRAKNGSYYWVDTTITPFRDANGKIRQYIAIRSDVTVRKNTQLQLARQTKLLDIMNSVAVAANLATAPSDMEYFCLQKICKFCEWKVGQVFTCIDSTTGQIRSGKNFYFGDDIRFEAFLEASLEKTFQQGEGLIGRVFDEGNPLWVTDVTIDPTFTRSEAAKSSGLKGAAIIPVKVGDEVVAVLEFMSDKEILSGLDELEILSFVTQQMSRTEERARTARELGNHRDHLQDMVNSATKELEDRAVRLAEALATEKEMNELQRQFVAMASHEFRTPLAIIDSTAQRIKSRMDKNKLTPEDMDERLQNIRVAVQRMTKLMESILSTARMEAGMAKLVAAPCDIGRVIQEICEHQQEISPGHNITWSLVGFPETIDAFAGSLEQIFTNLLSNAVKYAPDAPDIDVYGWVENDQVVISLQDQGLGIDEEDIEKIGQRFFRAKTATSIEGTGIGLNLVKTLIEEHGGTLSVESVKGEGSTFTVRLPIGGPVEDHSQVSQLAAASA